MSRLITQGLRTLCGGPFSFTVERGGCAALSGPSGCGKTLLLRAIADLDPAEGTVLLDGADRAGIAAPQWRRKVGWLPAESVWWFDVTGAHFRSRWTEDRSRDLQVLEQLGFSPDVLGWRVDRLSTGEKQRLALFRLLLNEPQVLLLDEPTAALDRASVYQAEAVIAEYRRSTGAAVVWVSHDPEQIGRIADCHLRVKTDGLETVQ